VVNPYIDHGEFRTFSESLNADELLWHWDDEDRTIKPTEFTDWKFQFDNERAFILGEHEVFIKAGTWHRLIKGTRQLVIHITRVDELRK
jgi:hypothetical protein